MGRLLIIIAVIAVVFYVYHRVRAWRLPDSLEKKINDSRARFAIGIFLLAFSVNLLFVMQETAVQIIVGVVFLIFGIANAHFGFKSHKHYVAQLPE
ncbi:YtpI family protein [Shouchella shacheensis]|uniref:YtpI family protein n=1 Tax=Shouchella shacheensis TaxID=1649580 RepID=UPI00073FBE16|nr:YtpI family protein [Shouchella shacheensis]